MLRELNARCDSDITALLETADRAAAGRLLDALLALAHGPAYEPLGEFARSLEPVRPIIERDAEGGYLAKLPDGTAFAIPSSLFPK